MVRASIGSFRTSLLHERHDKVTASRGCGARMPDLGLDTQGNDDDDSQLSYIETVMAPLILEALLGSSMEEQCG